MLPQVDVDVKNKPNVYSPAWLPIRVTLFNTGVLHVWEGEGVGVGVRDIPIVGDGVGVIDGVAVGEGVGKGQAPSTTSNVAVNVVLLYKAHPVVGLSVLL